MQKLAPTPKKKSRITIANCGRNFGKHKVKRLRFSKGDIYQGKEKVSLDDEALELQRLTYQAMKSELNAEASELDKIRKEIMHFETFPGDNDDVATRSQQDVEALRIMRESRKKVGKQYQVSVLWKPGEPDFENNFSMSKKRLESLERSYHFKDPALRAAFWQHIKDWEAKGYFKRVPKELMHILNQRSYPMFPVVRTDKTTTKIRPVLDGAAKFKGKSINDACFKGPNVINNLPSVLTRFRKYKIALGGDVAEMFLQILNRPEDRQYQRILFRENPEDDIVMLEPQVHVFGNAGSPCIAIFTITEHAKENAHKYPRAAEAVQKSSIVDDIMDSVQTVEEAIQMYKDLKQLFDECGMNIRKFFSNHEEVLNAIPTEDRAKNIDIILGDKATADIPYTIVKALGMIWLSKPDIFTFCFDHPEILREDFKWTKREMLRVQHQIYDPLGLISPFLLLAKFILQSVWEKGFPWDDYVGDEISALWKIWLSYLKHLTTVSVPRCLIPVAVGIQLHIFADASELAYGAVIYVVSGEEATRVSNIVCANTRIVSKKGVTIPRLELCAARLASQMALEVTNSLGIRERYFWTDSKNVLYWLTHHDKPRKLFVTNRVTKVLEMSKPTEWNWVPGPSNPADIASRGEVLPNLDQFWYQGPDFVKLDKDEWPPQPQSLVLTEDAEREDRIERQPTKLTSLMCFKSLMREGKGWSYCRLHQMWYEVDEITNFDTYPFNIEDHSTYGKAQRVATIVTAWRDYSKIPQPKPGLGTYRKTPKALYEASVFLIRRSQLRSFADVFRTFDPKKPHLDLPAGHRLAKLKPYMSSEGVIKVHGRFCKSKLPDQLAIPAILDGKSHLAKLLIAYYHRIKLQHYGGVNHLLAQLSRYFYIIGGRRAVKEHLRNCVTCIRAHPHSTKQIMAPLPDYRVPKQNLTAPFLSTGMDCAGPFRCAGRKVWVVVFTCAEYRAVHFEAVSEMSTDKFLLAFHRFISIRGMPNRVITDNGTNFTGASNQLKESKNKVNCNILQETIPEVEWLFTTPHCPHAGGFFERMVQSMKLALNKIIGTHLNPSIEYFITALYQAADLINSRPLTYLSYDVNDPEPITPNHFLRMWYMDKTTVCPQVEFDQVYKKLERIMTDLKRQFALELIPTLHALPKGWRKERDNLKVGDVVVLIEVNHVGLWPLARVTKVYPGEDGKVRHVDLDVILPKKITNPKPVKDESKLRWNARKCGSECDFYKTILKRDVRRVVRLNITDSDPETSLQNDQDQGGNLNENPPSPSTQGTSATAHTLEEDHKVKAKAPAGCTCQFKRLTFDKWLEMSKSGAKSNFCQMMENPEKRPQSDFKTDGATRASSMMTSVTTQMPPKVPLGAEKEIASLKPLAANDTLAKKLPVISIHPAEFQDPVTGVDLQDHPEHANKVLEAIFGSPRTICEL